MTKITKYQGVVNSWLSQVMKAVEAAAGRIDTAKCIYWWTPLAAPDGNKVATPWHTLRQRHLQ
jgi:hypothetical protein